MELQKHLSLQVQQLLVRLDQASVEEALSELQELFQKQHGRTPKDVQEIISATVPSQIHAQVIEYLGYEAAAHWILQGLMYSVEARPRGCRKWEDRVLWASYGRRYLRTGNGFVGLVPYDTKEGDIIVILYGGPVPYVLRPKPSGSYILVGECYIHGIMHGEMLNDTAGKEEVFNIE
jgi:hypothetical protein